MSFIDYSFLTPVLEKWWEYRYGFFVRNYDQTVEPDFLIPDELCKDLSMTKDRFKEVFLRPSMGLSLSQLQQIAEVQTAILGHTFLELDQPVLFEVKQLDHPANNAVDWTLVNIYGLYLPGLDYGEDSRIPIVLPIKQCWYCGQPDFDPRKEKFNQKTRYCHTKNCKSISSAKIHDHDIKRCCLRKWKKLKGETETKFDRCYGSQEKAEKVFWDFCEEQYHRNLKHVYTLRTPKSQPDLKVEKYVPGHVYFNLEDF